MSENSCQFASYSVCNNRFFLNLRQVMYQMGQQAKTNTDVEDPSGSWNSCEMNKGPWFLAHCYQFPKPCHEKPIWCSTMAENSYTCLIRDLFSKHIKVLFMSFINKIIPVSIALLKIIHSSLSGSCNSNCSSRSQFQNLLLRNANCGCCGKEGTLLLLRTFEVFELTFKNIRIKRVFQKIWIKLG